MQKRDFIGKLKKMMISVFTGLLVTVGLTATTTMASTRSFQDVTDKGKYYFKPVYWAVEKGITSGTSSTRFSPDEVCTRGEIVTFLYKAFGNGECVSSAGFDDISDDKYYYNAVNWAVKKGITSGTGNGMFSPDGLCTRAQIVTFLYRAAGSPKIIKRTNFADVSLNRYYFNSVSWAVQQGITSGVGDNLFDPNAVCTRGQAVTFLYKYVNHNRDIDVKLPEFQKITASSYDVAIKVGEQKSIQVKFTPDIRSFYVRYDTRRIDAKWDEDDTRWDKDNEDGYFVPLNIRGIKAGATQIKVYDKDNANTCIDIKVNVVSKSEKPDTVTENTDYIMGAFGIDAIKRAALNPDSVYFKEAFVDLRNTTIGNGNTVDRMFISATAMNKMGGYSPVYCTVIKVQTNENYPNAKYYNGYYYATFVFDAEPYDLHTYNVTPRTDSEGILNTYQELFGGGQ